MSQFRGPLPLDDRDFAEVRRSVLAKIEKRPPVLQWTLAVAAAIALVFVLMPKTGRRTPAPAAERPRAAAPTHVAVRTAEVPATSPQQPEPQQKPEPQPEPRQIASVGAAPSDSDITMNIQTADPNVRIIWISR